MVVEKLAAGIILGIDFLKKYGGVIDTRKYQLDFRVADLCRIERMQKIFLREIKGGGERANQVATRTSTDHRRTASMGERKISRIRGKGSYNAADQMD